MSIRTLNDHADMLPIIKSAVDNPGVQFNPKASRTGPTSVQELRLDVTPKNREAIADAVRDFMGASSGASSTTILLDQIFDSPILNKEPRQLVIQLASTPGRTESNGVVSNSESTAAEWNWQKPGATSAKRSFIP